MKKLYAILILALISLWNAIYLTISAFDYKAWNTSSLFCDLNNTFSCSNLFSFDFAWIFWIPFPFIAVVVYPILALIAILWILKKCKKAFHILLVLWIWWMMFNSYIIYNEYLVWVYCLACLACTISITTITILSAIWVKQKNTF